MKNESSTVKEKDINNLLMEKDINPHELTETAKLVLLDIIMRSEKTKDTHST